MKKFLKWRLFALELLLSLFTSLATAVIATVGLNIDPLVMAPIWLIAGTSYSLPFAWFLGIVSKRESGLGWLVSQFILAVLFVRWILTFQNPNDLGFVTLVTIVYIAFLVLGAVTIDSFFKQERF